MLILTLKINKDEKDEVYVHNEKGDWDGVCTYKVTSKQHGVVGYLEHDRRKGMWKLVEEVAKLIDYHEFEYDGSS